MGAHSQKMAQNVSIFPPVSEITSLHLCERLGCPAVTPEREWGGCHALGWWWGERVGYPRSDSETLAARTNVLRCHESRHECLYRCIHVQMHTPIEYSEDKVFDETGEAKTRLSTT